LAPQAGSPRLGWRQRLFGSLLGQLRLAAFTSVLLGFTAASAFTLLINQQFLLRQQTTGQMLAAGTLTRSLDQSSSAPSAVNASHLHQELDRLSIRERLFWVQRRDGSLLLPGLVSGEPGVNQGFINKAMAATQGTWQGLSITLLLVGTDRGKDLRAMARQQFARPFELRPAVVGEGLLRPEVRRQRQGEGRVGDDERDQGVGEP